MRKPTLLIVDDEEGPRQSLQVVFKDDYQLLLAGDGPDHSPGHTTLDLATGKNFGERWGLKLTATNVTNNRYLLDESNTFGGTHFYDARRVSLQLSYKFHY